jgi:hypothetical protein
MPTKPEEIAPLLKQAVEARIRVFELIDKIEQVAVGDVTEVERMRVDEIIDRHVTDLAFLCPEMDDLLHAEELIQELEAADELKQ